MEKKNSRRPLISVVMSVFNTPEEYLHQAVKSILEQDFTDFEFIIIDDHSTLYRVEDLLAGYADDRIRIIDNDRNLGLALSLNKGIESSSGVYIARMDSDDIALSCRLGEQARYMNEHEDTAVLGSRARLFGCREGIRKSIFNDPESIRTNLLFNVGITHPSVMMRKSFLTEHHCMYDPVYRKAQDYDLWTRIDAAHGRICETDRVLMNYRIYEGQASSKSSNSDQRAFAGTVRSRQLARLGLKPTEREEYIHRYISENGSEGRPPDFAEVIGWEKKIIRSNKSRNLYKTGVLKNVMTYHTLSLLKQRKLSGVSLKTLWAFFTEMDLSVIRALIASVRR